MKKSLTSWDRCLIQWNEEWHFIVFSSCSIAQITQQQGVYYEILSIRFQSYSLLLQLPYA